MSDPGCELGPECLTPETIVGATMGAMMGATFTPWIIGSDLDYDFDPSATMLGAGLGLGLSVLLTLRYPDSVGLLIPVLTGVGGAVGFLVADRSAVRLQWTPTQDGATAGVAFTF